MCVCVCSGCTLCYVFINAAYGVLYRSVCVGTGGLCSPGCGRGVCVCVCVCVAEFRGGGLRFWGFCVCL